jgi:hypothetical protein
MKVFEGPDGLLWKTQAFSGAWRSKAKEFAVTIIIYVISYPFLGTPQFT